MDRISRKSDEKRALMFAPISLFSPGMLADIVRRSYAELIERSPLHWAGEAAKWDDFDRETFAHPETVGKCLFVSRLDDETVGLASYDPREAPSYGIVGQNCVLPEFRGRGFGTLQISEILRRFREKEIRTARVTTSGHPFFLPARRMYESLGFKEVRRFAGGPDPNYGLIDFELTLAPLK
ncbi:MAG TPA: GNAT family N-acetyltransferase [Terriglobales bacterium]|nr:GNAT family N-acetyltransferase [Terriglobales bacterium]